MSTTCLTGALIGVGMVRFYLFLVGHTGSSASQFCSQPLF